MANELKGQAFAQGRVTGATGAAAVTGTRNWQSARTGPGVYTITWVGTQIDALQSISAGLVPRNAAARIMGISAQSDASITIVSFDAAGVAADSDFDFEIKVVQL